VAEAREQRAAIAAALRALPSREQVVVALFYDSGYPQQEIARLLQVPLTTVKKRLQAARKRLRERMVSLVDDGARRDSRKPADSANRRRRRLARALAGSAFDDGRQILELLLVDGAALPSFDVKSRTPLSSLAMLLRRMSGAR
jgi:hypothetical protein